MRLRAHAPALLIAVTAVSAAACLLPSGSPYLRLPFGFALMFVLPGFALWSAIFPDRPRDPLRVIVFSLGLSTVLAVVAGVEMGAYGDLSTTSWTILMAGLILVATAVAHARRRDDGEHRPSRSQGRVRATRPARVGAALATVAALFIIGAAIGLARTPLPVPHDRGYTVLSIDPLAASSSSIQVTIASREATTRTFRLEIYVPGSPGRIEPLRIEPGETIRERIALPPAGSVGVIRARLMHQVSGGWKIYRRVRIGLPVPGPALPVLRSGQR